ncbi:MAG: PD-(D/E)XK nuclease family protein [Endomicrobiaceae bacterium]|nr:PD-(D/E)XK nuclease family protein [Endomicrobiaceae bacterium]
MKYDFIINDMVWSFSRITTFEDCPYQWFLIYIYGSEKRSGFFAEYGTFMHDILGKYLSGDLSKNRIIPYYTGNFLANVSTRPPRSATFRNYFQDGLNYLSNINFPHSNIIAVEDEIDFVFAGHKFVGFIDCLSNDDGLTITDHKSRALKQRSKRKTPTRNDEELDLYYRQLYVYAAGVKAKYGEYPKWLEFNCFRTNTLIREPFDESKLRETEQWASELISKITACDKWNPYPDYWHCKELCDVSQECEFREMI